METKKKIRKTYSLEFKHEAVQLVAKLGTSEASKQLGVDSTSLRSWRRKYGDEIDASESNTKMSYADLEKENRRLKKEIGYINEINKVLKKSTAILSSDLMGNLK